MLNWTDFVWLRILYLLPANLSSTPNSLQLTPFRYTSQLTITQVMAQQSKALVVFLCDQVSDLLICVPVCKIPLHHSLYRQIRNSLDIKWLEEIWWNLHKFALCSRICLSGETFKKRVVICPLKTSIISKADWYFSNPNLSLSLVTYRTIV